MNSFSRLCLDVAGNPGVTVGSSIKMGQCETDEESSSNAEHRWIYTEDPTGPRGSDPLGVPNCAETVR